MLEEKRQGRMQILVVDDDPSILNFFKRLFGGQHSLSVAMDGEEAVKMAQHRKYSLVFLDIRLPGIGGIDVLSEIKKINPDTITIMMSGYDAEEEAKQAIDKGAQEFLKKPFRDIDKIMTIKDVAEYLSLHQLTVYRLAQHGKIPFFKTGRQWRIKKDVLEQWVEQEVRRVIKK